MTELLKPINWGDEIKPDSVWSYENLGYAPTHPYATVVLVVLSRDGSRRIVYSPTAGVSNPLIRPNDVHDGSRPDKTFQGWKGIKLHAEWIKTDPGQTVFLLQHPKGEGHYGAHRFPGNYLPHGVIGAQTRVSLVPVNPIPAMSKVRDAISTIAAGWDTVWHSRYVFSDHLRQQVTSRVVDGLLADIERNIQTLLTDARPSDNDYWKAKIPPIEAAAKALCGICTGDPYLWARTIARNIDLDAFRLRLDQGEVPAMNLTTKPWQPGATVASVTYPPATDVNEKKELAARWHDTNRAIVEDDILRWYDEDLHDDPEPIFEPTDDHFHQQ